MTLSVRVDPTYPKNNPASPQYVRNLMWMVAETASGTGFSYTYDPSVRSWSNGEGPGHGDNVLIASFPGTIMVSEAAPAVFQEADAQRWSARMRSALAMFVQKGILQVDITSIGSNVTPDQIRTFAVSP